LSETFRGGVAIGDQVLDLAAVHKTGVFAQVRPKELAQASGESLNPFLALGRHVSSDLRLALSKALRTAPLKSVDVFM
jgi:fumarylacetoacetase